MSVREAMTASAMLLIFFCFLPFSAFCFLGLFSWFVFLVCFLGLFLGGVGCRALGSLLFCFFSERTTWTSCPSYSARRHTARRPTRLTHRTLQDNIIMDGTWNLDTEGTYEHSLTSTRSIMPYGSLRIPTIPTETYDPYDEHSMKPTRPYDSL
ncbi:hypothetical protein K470DRAFT_48460 [Piedraia hortae CBS 480.64]|uniref:Uncharacterized protein n=1 Tax=Piedraia hortae CBS 480.64 TaxID=1314780 RepID=A0A6A7C956_9PEZI|nr:hypothetical protein K470DRAFT_48460 [Piedraia hortae CBS 480.64]